MSLISNMKRSTAVIAVIVTVVFLLIRCAGDADKKAAENKSDNFKKYAGTLACVSCHKDVNSKHIYTEHHLTSAQANEISILGSFEPEKNIFPFGPATNVTMEKRDSGLYQVEYINKKEIRKGKFDIVVGSGRKGQSYLSW